MILGVKPQIFGQMDSRLLALMAAAPTVSIIDGIPLARLAEGIGHSRVIRVMPNLPVMIGASMSLGCVGAGATPHLIEALFGAIGRFDWAVDGKSSNARIRPSPAG